MEKKEKNKTAYLNLSGIVYDEQSKGTEDFGVITKRQVVDFIQANQSAEKIVVTIHSRGGDVSEGFAIYDALRNSGKKIKTVGEGLVASIATVIFMAGDERVLTENTDFFIHCPWGEPWQMSGFTADDYAAMAENIRQAEEKILNFYVNKTGADRDLLLDYMKEEKTFSADQAVELKFATELIKTNNKKNRVGAVAYLGGFNKTKNQNSKNSEPMSKDLKAIQDTLSAIGKTLSNLAKGKATKDEGEQNSTVEVTLEDDSVLMVEASGEVPAVGDSVTIDGSTPDDGDYVEKETGTVYGIAAGVIATITPKAEDSKEDKPEDKKDKPADAAAKAKAAKQTPEVKALADRISALEKNVLKMAAEKKAAQDELTKVQAEKDKLESTLPAINKALSNLAKQVETLAKGTGSDFDPGDREEGEEIDHHNQEGAKSKNNKDNLAAQAIKATEAENKLKAEGKSKAVKSIWAE